MGDTATRSPQDAVREQERRFRSTVERVADGILVVDRQGRILFINPAGERIFGRASAQLVGTELGLPLVAGENTTVDLHGSSGTRTGELRVVETTWGDQEAFLLSVRDITERRESEERERDLLREQLARTQAEESAARSAFLAEATRVLVASRDQDEILIELARLIAARVAEHCVISVGANPGPGRYRRVVAMRTGDGGSRMVSCTERGPDRPAPSALARGLHERRTTERISDPGPDWLERSFADREERELWRSFAARTVVAAPIMASSGPIGMIGVASCAPDALGGEWEAIVGDVAHRTGLALDNLRLLGLTEEASRAKSDFLAIISHELRTPLTGITGYAGLLCEELERPMTARERRYVDGILKSADRLLGVIDQILLFAGSRSGHEARYEAVALADVVADVVRVARPLAREARLHLTVQVPPDVRVTTDPEMLRHILLHLATNAIKFTDRGGVTLGAALEDGRVRLHVADTGRGIRPDQLQRIFEPFSQVEPPHTRAVGGTGLGLSVVQNLVRALGGELRVDSEPGEGTTCTVTLPQPMEGAAGPTGAERAGGSGDPGAAE